MKDLLKGSYTYLVGAIEYAGDCFSWRDAVTESLSSMGIKCFDPNKDHFTNQTTETAEDRVALQTARKNGDWAFVRKYMKGVIQRDLRMVDLSTFIVAKIDPAVPTFGTIHEIVMASLQNKAILIYTEDKTKFPLWLCGLVNMDLVFETWEELLGYLHKINEGEIYADPKYWKILSHEQN